MSNERELQRLKDKLADINPSNSEYHPTLGESGRGREAGTLA